MNENGTGSEMERAELLERYMDELEMNPNAQPPQGLDAKMIEAAQRMKAHFTAPEPNTEFAAALGRELDGAAGAMRKEKGMPRGGGFMLPRWSLAGAGAAIVLAVGALLFFATRPPSVSAQELLDHARSAASDLESVGVKSFEMTQTSFDLIVDDPNTPPARQSKGEMKTWYAGPTRWRTETKNETTNQPTFQTVTVSDGETQWDYNVKDKTVNVQTADAHNFPSPSVLSLDFLSQDMSNCYEPKVVGEETIAGRATYKVYLGPAKCRSASVWWLNGPHTIWLDKETFFMLKSEIRAENSDQISSQMMVTEIRYNLYVPGELLTFAPPPDARVNDMRAKPAPSASEYEGQLQEIARRADFPIFLPEPLPSGLTALAPKLNEVENQVELGFVPPDKMNGTGLADSFGILIYEKKADYDLVQNWTDGAQEIEVTGNQGWVRRGDFDVNSGTGSNSAVIVLRDGVLISISSFRIAPEKLVEVAKSLKTVEGSHAPLPNPTAPSLAEIRAQVDYPYFVPTYVPEGLTPKPPARAQLLYTRADGTVALIVQNAKQGEGGMETYPKTQAQKVVLANGAEAWEMGANADITILWWYQEGGYVALEGHGISQEEMVKIADGMSSNAELK